MLGGTAQGPDNDTRTFLLKTMEGGPQFGLHLRSVVKESQDLTDEDWKFLATHLKLALGYAADAIKTMRLYGYIWFTSIGSSPFLYLSNFGSPPA
jgi:hypothetical protein